LLVGYETAKGLVSRGAKVYMACRDVAAAEQAKTKIEQENTVGSSKRNFDF
jgi:short-subunit dehydrogenase